MNNYLQLEYPYYNLYYEFIKKDFLKLVKNYIPEIYNELPYKLKNSHLQKYNDSYFIIKDDYTKTSEINNITDYFSENVRVNCKFGNYPSPLQYWKNNKHNILKKTLEKYKKINIYNIRETIFFNTHLCNNFRISVCLEILKFFKVKKWLDISCGWGDRLISALLYKVKLYVSCDPNLDLHPYYTNMIDIFSSTKRKKDFIIYPNGFLEAPIENNNFDIVFSSPPFFTLEKYSDYSEDSLKKYKSEKEWCTNFFLKSLIKAYNLLNKNGHIVLYMGGSEYVMQSMHKLDKIMKYEGVIYFYDTKPRGMFVWKKLNNKKIIDL
jgi:hypothetical protein